MTVGAEYPVPFRQDLQNSRIFRAADASRLLTDTGSAVRASFHSKCDSGFVDFLVVLILDGNRELNAFALGRFRDVDVLQTISPKKNVNHNTGTIFHRCGIERIGCHIVVDGQRIIYIVKSQRFARGIFGNQQNMQIIALFGGIRKNAL